MTASDFKIPADEASSGGQHSRLDDHYDFSSTSYQRVHEHLREEIIAGRIPPGSRLKIAEIAKKYAISQMPVREALQQLQGEGLIVIAPNKGATVRAMDTAFVRNVFDIRIALETYLTRQAAENITDKEIKLLFALQAQLDRADELHDIDTHVKLNGEFHKVIINSTGNQEALRLLNLHGDLIGAIRLRYRFRPGRLMAIRQEHLALINALQRRDAEAAASIHFTHLQGARDDLLTSLKESEAA